MNPAVCFARIAIRLQEETANTKFWAIATWAGRNQTEYSNIYYYVQENQVVPVRFYLTEYFLSLSTRLYNFDGQAVTPEKTLVISYQHEVSQGGTPFKLITGAEEFETYEEAEEYILSQESGNYIIVSDNKFNSPVPLEAVEDYQLIHSSNSTLTRPDGETVPAVKIFEYIGQ